MSKSEAGKLGQAALRKKLGADYSRHMSRIGELGAIAFWQKYTLIPADLSNFAIVNRVTHKVVGYTNGH